MKVKIGNKIYSSYEEPIALLFDDDFERLKLAASIYDLPESKGQSAYVRAPKGKFCKEEIERFTYGK